MKYLLQAAHGQLALTNHAKPLAEVIQDERTPPYVRELLQEIQPIKTFGEKYGLKPTKNYQEYVKLDRKAAVWVVSASEPLQFRAKEWKFPIVGRFPYLGWFDLDSAKTYAESLRTQGWDVDVRGARAYSTLGWFRDSILSTMIAEDPTALGELINVVLHESVHATIYLSGQASFNESLAEFVAGELTTAYLTETRGPQSKEEKAYQQSEKKWVIAKEKLHQAYLSLSQLYESTRSADEKLTAKQAILAQLEKELVYGRAINNATLLQFKTYHTGADDFSRLYKELGRNWLKFWENIHSVKEDWFTSSQQEDLAPIFERLRTTSRI